MVHNSNPLAVEILHYNCWANVRMIDACAALTPEQLAATAPGTYGGILDTLKHIIRSEASYLRRITGVRLEPPFAWDDAPQWPAVRAYAQQVGDALAEAAGRMQATDTLERDWNDPEWEGYPSQFRAVGLLIQVVNHGVEHRTNITTILAGAGLDAPYLDGWEYMRLNPERMGV